MIGISFNRLAERELAEAAEYYDEESPGLGRRFLEEVEYSTLLLKRHPYAAAKFLGSIRRFVLPGFPYYLLYRVTAMEKIRVLAIAHQKRNPRYWLGRS